MIITQLFYVKNVCKNVKSNMFKMDVRTFGSQYTVAYVSIFYPTVSGIITISLKSIGQL